MEPDHKKTYQDNAIEYERLIAREDFQGNLLPELENISGLKSKTLLDLGSGTGRIARLVAPHVNRVLAMDISLPMLKVAKAKLRGKTRENFDLIVADHRNIPLAPQFMDIVISGWSICYLVDWFRSTWKTELAEAFSEMKRILQPDGKIILIETQGTGFEEPHPPDHLLEYFKYLGEMGFDFRWIRTDYRFADLEEAEELSTAFFGEEMGMKIVKNDWKVLPECTGIWWGSIKDLNV
jgi:ubiquinone/menaquinone biosynthesis C-methylase UbiE